MVTTQPIREKNDLKQFLDYYKTVQPNPRNYALLTLGLHTALRVSDLLSLHWSDVYDFSGKRYKEHLFIQEKKTGKHTVIALNAQAAEALTCLKQTRKEISANDYIFTKSTDYTLPLCRSQAYRIVKRAAEESLHKEHISCHSLRKTFGYQA